MDTLKFSNFNLIEDVVLTTVRRGVKWASLSKGDIIPTGFSNGEILGKVEILSVTVIRMSDVKDDMLKNEHDTNCRTKAGLLNELKSVYKNFDENEIITLLDFYYQELLNT